MFSALEHLPLGEKWRGGGGPPASRMPRELGGSVTIPVAPGLPDFRHLTRPLSIFSFALSLFILKYTFWEETLISTKS